ncbi:MAG: hypothetical protein HY744_31405 [Deltaproteobacteria bacterium]|nr:hypothetical protein [Deltaproteobacteria bacterium]
MTIGIGDLIDGKYRLVALLGEGGMGAVYEGVNERIGKRVAIKVLHPQVAQDQANVTRFEREARAAGSIGSRHICEVLDLGELADGTRYMVMEHLVGESPERPAQARGTHRRARGLHRRPAASRRAGRGSRCGHHPSRPQARQRLPARRARARRRVRQDRRLRHQQVPGRRRRGPDPDWGHRGHAQVRSESGAWPRVARSPARPRRVSRQSPSRTGRSSWSGPRPCRAASSSGRPRSR